MSYTLPAWRRHFSSYYCYGPIPYLSLSNYLSGGRKKNERPIDSRIRLYRAGEAVDLLYLGKHIARVYPGDIYELYQFDDPAARRHLLALVGHMDLQYASVDVPQLLRCYFNPFNGIKIDRWGRCLNPPVLWRADLGLADVAQTLVRRLEKWRALRGLSQKVVRVHIRLQPYNGGTMRVYLARFGYKFRALLCQDLEQLGVFSALAARRQELLFMFELTPLTCHEALLVLD